MPPKILQPPAALRIQPLASGSAGNCLLIQTERSQILIDAGLPAAEIAQRMTTVGALPSRTRAIFLTHRHRDHARGATDFVKSYRCKVFGTPRTLRALGSQTVGRTQRLHKSHGLTQFDDLYIENFAVEHDAPEACGFRITAAGFSYGHLTDAGRVTTTLVEGLAGCHVLGIEFNHDLGMLHEGPYPPHLKTRVAGPRGHLSNAEAAQLLSDVAHPGLRHVFLLHRSRTNNTVELATEAGKRGLGTNAHGQISVAVQDSPTDAVVCTQTNPQSSAAATH